MLSTECLMTISGDLPLVDNVTSVSGHRNGENLISDLRGFSSISAALLLF
jgi:hypothetical protein